MAHSYVTKVKTFNGGTPPARWFDIQTKIPGWNLGEKILVTDFEHKEKVTTRNRAVIVFQDRKVLQNSGAGCVTAVPVCIMDAEDAYMKSFFEKDSNPVFRGQVGPVYVIPLLDLTSSPDHKYYFGDSAAMFVTARRGGNEYNEPNIANALACSLQSISYNLALEITLDSKVPDEKKQHFMITALREMAFVARNAAAFSKDIRNIFEVLPLAANSSDTLQSILMCFLFDKTPCDSILINWVGLIIKRYFRHAAKNRKSRFADPQTPATGIIACLLIVPMIAELISNDLGNSEIINQITGCINAASLKIATAIADSDHALDQHEENKLVLRTFTEATKVKLIKTEIVDDLYDCVVAGKSDDFASELKLTVVPSFDAGGVLTYSGKQIRTTAVLIFSNSEEKEAKHSYTPSHISQWCGKMLKPGKYSVQFREVPPGRFVEGNTRGMNNVANIRFTAGPDLMEGKYPGFSSSRMVYDRSARRKFTKMENYIKFSLHKSFIVDCQLDGIHVSQDGGAIFHIPCEVDDAKDLCPMIAFKFCAVDVIELRSGTPAPAPVVMPPAVNPDFDAPPPYEELKFDAPGGPGGPHPIPSAPQSESAGAVVPLSELIEQLRLSRPPSGFGKRALNDLKKNDK